MIAEFAQIVGLLSSFASGRQSDQALNILEFLEWLTVHNHSELRAKIEQNQTTAISIKALLNEGLNEVHGKLDYISSQLVLLSGRTRGIENLAMAYSSVSLSDQAIEILKLMHESKTQFFLLSNATSERDKRLVLAPGPNYVCKETQFLKDDLDLMVNLGLLRLGYNKSGESMYYFTRPAAKLVESLV
tara:strand:- start:1519 stop:2082 length:564 start_codon:yes stop_codon:yes gene_type:complete